MGRNIQVKYCLITWYDNLIWTITAINVVVKLISFLILVTILRIQSVNCELIGYIKVLRHINTQRVIQCHNR